MISHQASKFCLPRFNKDPQVTMSSGTPIPKNDRPLSIRIADAIPNAILTKTGARAFGRACLKIVLIEENPRLSFQQRSLGISIPMAALLQRCGRCSFRAPQTHFLEASQTK